MTVQHTQQTPLAGAPHLSIARQIVAQHVKPADAQADKLLEVLKNGAGHDLPVPPRAEQKLSKDADNSEKVERILDKRTDPSRVPTPGYTPLHTGPGMPMLPPNFGDADSSAEILVEGLSGKEHDQILKELNRPLAAAEYLKENWGKWDLGKHANVEELVKNPPGKLPQEAKDLLRYLKDHPSLLNAIDTANAKGAKPDGLLSKDDVQAFVGHYKDQQEKAAKVFSEWQSNNKNAGGMATELARTAAILVANEALLHGADTKVPDDKNPLASLKGTKALSHEDFGIISDAAQLFGREGMFAQIDRSGVNIATHDRDQLFNVDNLTKWLKNSAPKNDKEAVALFEKAATHTAIATMQGDTSKIKGDLFNTDKQGNITINKDKFSTADRAAAMIELQDARAKLTAGAQQGLYRFQDAEKYGINPNPDKLAADLDKRIAALASDEDMAKSMATKLGNAYQAVAKANPLLAARIEHHYGHYVENGNGLKDAVNGKQTGPDGKALSLGDGLGQFISEAGTLARMLGKGEPNLSEILNKGELKDVRKKIHDTYINEVVDGDRIAQIIKDDPKIDIEEAIARAGREAIAITAATDPRMVKMHKDLQNSNFTENATRALVENTDMSDVAKQFTKADGSMDEAKLEEVLKNAEKVNDKLFKDAQGKSMAPDILRALRGAWDAGRNAAKVSDVLTKDTWQKVLQGVGSTNNNKLDPIYKNGVMHGVSALFGAFALTARAGAKKDANAKDIASYMGSALAVVGTGIESGSKYDATHDGADRKKLLGKIEQAGKMLGGAGNIIAGVTGIISGVGQLGTNRPLGAVNITSGTLFATAGALSIVEGSSALAGFSRVAHVAGGISGALGVAAGVFTVGIAIWQLVEMAIKDNRIAKDSKTFWSQIDPVLDRYGANGGPVEESDKPKKDPDSDLDPTWVYFPT